MHFVCPVNPIIAKETINELCTHSVSVKESKFKPYICPVLTKESVFELSVLPVSVNELSASVSVYAPDFELSVNPVPANAFDYELSDGTVTIN